MSTGPPAGSERENASKFSTGLRKTKKDLRKEMERLGVENWRLDYSKNRGQDPGVVVRWTKDGEDHAVACDAFTTKGSNLRSVYLWINETRMRSQRPVKTGSDEFAAARLPSGDSEEDVVVARKPPHEVLGVGHDASDDEVRDAYREALKDAHPDAGGSREEFDRVTEARDAMLGGDGQ